MSEFDIFISHASEDKALVVHPIAEQLRQMDFKVWLDDFELTLGDRLVEGIDRGLSSSRFGVVVLSRAFFAKEWPKRELAHLLSREATDGKVILPVLHEVDQDTVRSFCGALAGKLAVETRDGIPAVVAEIVRVIRSSKRAVPTPDDVQLKQGVNPDLSPYVGPFPFDEGMFHRFFGRDDEIRSLIEIINTSRTVLVYAPSGAGKSSLLNTLSARDLRRRGFDVVTARVGGVLPEKMQIENVGNMFTFSAICSCRGKDAAPKPRWQMRDYLRSLPESGPPGRILILDQFEELITSPWGRPEDRSKFFLELIDALEDDKTLRIVFAARQEYLADVEELAELFPQELKIRRFHLKRLGSAGALEAIIKPAAPYADFSPEAAEVIVQQLSMVPVASVVDGSITYRPSEFVDMVQLQIVCDSLWERLPREIRCIQKAHVDLAAGSGKAFEKFVANALQYFYDSTLDKVLESEATRARGGYSKELLQLGCQKFITDAATRTMVRRSKSNLRTGRLPGWIIEQLVTEHLLRFEERGGEVWYELSHDRLAEPIRSQRMTSQLNPLLFATDLLETVLVKLRGSLQGHFDEHRDILDECRPFHAQVGLFDDELEFMFRASLRAGQDMDAWSHRLKQDFPQVHAKVLQEALSSPVIAVRRNAAKSLGAEPTEQLLPSLATLAIRDDDPGVRFEAAMSLTIADRPELYRVLLEGLKSPRDKDRAIEALADIRNIVDNERDAREFRKAFAESTLATRRRIRGQAWRQRLRSDLLTPISVSISAAVFGAVAAGCYKGLPSYFNWAFVQPRAGAAAGVFHGIIAGPIWAGFIALGISLYQVALERKLAPRSILHPMGVYVAGVTGGLVGSAFLVMMMIGVYEPRSLYEMGWLTNPEFSRFSPEFWRDLFVTQRFGWVHLITGIGIGIGMAATVNALRTDERWQTYTKQQSQSKTPLIGQISGTLLKIALPYLWLLPLCIGLAAVCAFFVPIFPNPPLPDTKANPIALAEGLFGDCSTQAVGAYFAVAGMGLLEILLRRVGLPSGGRRT